MRTQAAFVNEVIVAKNLQKKIKITKGQIISKGLFGVLPKNEGMNSL